MSDGTACLYTGWRMQEHGKLRVRLLLTYTIYTQVRLSGLSFEREKRDADQAYEFEFERN